MIVDNFKSCYQDSAELETRIGNLSIEDASEDVMQVDDHLSTDSYPSQEAVIPIPCPDISCRALQLGYREIEPELPSQTLEVAMLELSLSRARKRSCDELESEVLAFDVPSKRTCIGGGFAVSWSERRSSSVEEWETDSDSTSTSTSEDSHRFSDFDTDPDSTGTSEDSPMLSDLDTDSTPWEDSHISSDSVSDSDSEATTDDMRLRPEFPTTSTTLHLPSTLMDNQDLQLLLCQYLINRMRLAMHALQSNTREHLDERDHSSRFMFRRS